ncbi:MAG: class II fructose-bisphosphate aldolase [Candidatus Caccosoma sp.]|nr:class II fructose-bisphosphate aldolase [Candidatus Caccosoma sp.]
MLVNLNYVLDYAKANDVAIGSFNTPNLENMIAVISAAESLNVPVIIMHAQCHEEYAPLDIVGPIMLLMAKNAKVPVCVHLDHCEDLTYLKRAIDLGFTSVMIDASSKPYDENVYLTKEAVKLAHAKNVSVEAEIGILGGREAGDSKPLSKEEMYTDPLLAKRFVEDTKIDALACSFGTAHGIYKVKPELDFERISKISELCKLPLVMHGGSGVSHEDYKKAIKRGVRKINYYSYMAKEGVMAAREIVNTDITFYHEIASYATLKMKDDVLKAMKVFYNK